VRQIDSSLTYGLLDKKKSREKVSGKQIRIIYERSIKKSKNK